MHAQTEKQGKCHRYLILRTPLLVIPVIPVAEVIKFEVWTARVTFIFSINNKKKITNDFGTLSNQEMGSLLDTQLPD